MGANYSFYMKTIEAHARAFFKVIIFSIGSVFIFGSTLFLLLYVSIAKLDNRCYHEVDGKKEYGAHRAKPGREKGRVEHIFYIGNH